MTKQDIARVAAGLTRAQVDFIEWVGGAVMKHIDVVSSPRLELIRAGLLHVTTHRCHLYANLTPLGHLVLGSILREKSGG